MKLSNISLAISAILLGSSANLWAEEQNLEAVEKNSAEQQKVKKEKVAEKITVTGSRIKRDSFSVATPLVIMERDEIVDTGISSLSEILVDNMPGISESTSNTTSQSSVSGTGLSTVQLRGLGSGRTLTLIDGRRVVSNTFSSNSVSMSTIPAGMVDRIEVISGGASATYGADAVAGVLNIITQTDKEGFSVKARAGESSDGGGREFTLDLDFGTEFADGQGYLYFASTWDNQYGLDYNDRDRAQIEDSLSYDDELMCNTAKIANGDYVCTRDLTQDQWASKSDGIPGGVFLESSRFDNSFWFPGDRSTMRDDWYGNEEGFGVNTNKWVALKVPNENFNTALKVDYELTDDVKLYAQVQYNINTAVNNKSPEDLSDGEYSPLFDLETGQPDGGIKLGYIPIDNPYVPQEIRDMAGQYKDRIYWDRRASEVGLISTDNDRRTLRTWTGLQGTMFDGGWDWDVSVGYGRFTQHQERPNEIDLVKFKQAMYSEYAEDGVTIQCQDADARAAGCVPIDLFGEGSITPEMADWVRTNPELDVEIEQLSFLGYATGDLFELPAGMVTGVFGAEYRKDTQKVETSEDLQRGGISWNKIPTFKGEVEVYEAFGELAVPVLRDAFMAKNLTLETSLRTSNYSIDGIDTMASYKLGFVWEVAEGYIFRGNWAKAQRAPTITELFSTERGDFDSVTDICDKLTTTSDEPGHDECRQDPTLAALLAEEPTLEFEADNGSTYSPSVGNSDLFEETAKTKTLGFTMSPSFLPNFNLAIDFYEIKIDDVIGTINNDDILKECYDSTVAFGTDNTFCNLINRDEEGQIEKILQQSYNLDSREVQGYDVAMTYKFDLGDFGRLKLKADMNHKITNSKTVVANDGRLEVDDYVKYGSPQDKASISLSWSKDDVRIRWSTKALSSFTRSESREELWLGYMAENDERCASESKDGCIDNPEKRDYQYFDAYFKHNLSASYGMKLSNDQRLTLSGGINNVFDDKGPFYPSGRGNYYNRYGGGIGRFYYLSAKYSF